MESFSSLVAVLRVSVTFFPFLDVKHKFFPEGLAFLVGFASASIGVYIGRLGQTAAWRL